MRKNDQRDKRDVRHRQKPKPLLQIAFGPFRPFRPLKGGPHA